MTQADIYIAKETAILEHDGAPVVVTAGVTRVRAGHPLLKGHEHLFKPLDVHYDVEDTRARPASGARKSVKKADSADGAE